MDASPAVVVAVLVVGVLVGLLVGAALAARWLRRDHAPALDAAAAAARAQSGARLAAAEARLSARDAEVRDLQARLQSSDEVARVANAALGDERVAAARLEAELRDERDRTGEKLALLSQARDDLSAHFRTLAHDALEVNRSRMAEQHHGALDTILRPLGEKLAAFEKKVEDTYDKEAQQRSSLRQEVLNLQQATARINEDAANLTRALKGEAKTRGNWGEVILERVLERSGLVRGQEYVIQHSLKDEDGASLRPDVVVYLPDNKHVVIDSKVSLVAYDRYHAAEDEPGRAQAGKQHVDGMRRHAKSLGEKSYQIREGIDSPDFVAMFVPIEPAFGLASSLDAGLFLDAWDRKVVIVTPSTLLALLATVQTLWQREKQTRNAIEIAEQSGKLYDKFVQVIESLNNVGRKLGEAQKAFEQTEFRLVSGRGNLVGHLDRIRKLGAKTKRQLEPGVLARSAGAGDAPMDDDAEADDRGDDDVDDGDAATATPSIATVTAIAADGDEVRDEVRDADATGQEPLFDDVVPASAPRGVRRSAGRA